MRASQRQTSYIPNYRLALALILSGLLAGTGSLPETAQAATIGLAPNLEKAILLADAAPTQVAEAVKRTLAQQDGIPIAQLKLVQAKAMTWPDGCLGLAQPDEFCTQALVNGWQVELTDGQNRWVYRSDRTGKTIRREITRQISGQPDCL